MADVVDQFRRLAWLLFKWSLVGAGLAGAFVASLAAHHWWTYDRHLALVKISATIGDPKCDTPEFPVLVRVENHSTKTIERTLFELTAKRPGRSSDVTVKYSTKNNDFIIPPGKTLTGCEIDELVDDAKGEDSRKLEWSAELVSVNFAE